MKKGDDVMSELETFQRVDNQTQQLSQLTCHHLAQDTATLWQRYTFEIRGLLQKSQESWQLYLDNKPSRSTGKRKGLRIGHIARSVDAVHAFQHNTTFPSEERFFKGTPLNDAARQSLDLYETWAATNLSQSGVLEAFFNHRKRLFIDGTACLSVQFCQKRARSVRYEFPTMRIPNPFSEGTLSLPLTFLPPQEVDDADAIQWEGTVAESLDFHDWRVDPSASTLEESPFLRRWYEPLWKVKKAYPNASLSQPYFAHRQDFSNHSAQHALGLNPTTWSIGQSEPEGEASVLLMVRYDNFVIDGVVYENHVLLVANDTEVLWFGPNPYHHGHKPYLITPYIPVPGSIYGKSQVHDAIPSAHAVDTAVTQILDIMSWAANPVFLKNIQDDAVKAQGDIVIQPGLHIPVTRNDAYQQLPINITNTQILANLISLLETNIRETTGATPLFTGDMTSLSSSQPTAFQVSAHLQGSNNRFQALMSFFNNSTLEPFMAMKWSNDRQFMSQEYVIPGFTRRLTPNMVKQMQVTWNITANLATLHRNQELANMKALIDMLPVLVENQLVSLKEGHLELDHTVLLKRFFVKAGLPDIDEFLRVSSSSETFPILEGDA
jgi:Bacteriophage head to tail connecting protein